MYWYFEASFVVGVVIVKIRVTDIIPGQIRWSQTINTLERYK